MKHLFILALVLASLLVSCSKDNEEDQTMKGQVQFSEKPVYADDKITFQAEILYSAAGQPAEVEFQVLENNVVLLEDKTKAETNIDGIGFSFRTPMISITAKQTDFAGKTLTVFLDPNNKLTSEGYTSQQYVDLYKKESVTIPE